MELNQAFATLEKQLAAINTELHFNREAGAEDALTFAGDNGLYRLHYVADKQLLEFDCAYEKENPQWSTVSRSITTSSRIASFQAAGRMIVSVSKSNTGAFSSGVLGMTRSV